MRPVKNRSNGFTLIEMAIVMIILGAAVAAFSGVYQVYLKEQAERKTQANIAIISEAIGAFRGINGRYPLPASLTAQRGDITYGREPVAAELPLLAAINPNNCLNDNTAGSPVRICVSRSIPARTLAYTDPYTGAALPNTSRPRVLVGAVPFRHLNMDENQSYDGYNNRILYVVTEHLAFDTTFDARQGGIEIQDESTASVVSEGGIGGTAHFLVLAAGEDGNGAYTRSGTQNPCGGGGLDDENCDVEDEAVYVQTNRRTARGAMHYDDVISYFTQSEVPLWQLSSDPNAQGDMHQKPTGNVGFAIPLTSFAGTAKAVVSGVVRADDDPDPTSPGVEGEFMVGTVGIDNTTRFTPSLIAGAPTPAMTCPAGQYAYAVRGGALQCAAVLDSLCPPGQVVRGVNAQGQMVCSTTPCGAQTLTICGSSVTLAAGSSGSTQNITAGANYRATYLCSNGTWVRQSQSGNCTCTPSTTVTNGLSCGTGFSGTMTRTCTVNCPAGNTTCTNNRSACVCVGAPQNRIPTCPSGFASNVAQQTRNFDCTASPPAWGPWLPPFNPATDCVCQPQAPSLETIACPGALTGNQTRFWTFNCPAGTWTATPWNTSACVCNPTSWTQDDPCPAGQIGAITNTYTVNCPSGTTTVSLVANTCAPPPPVQYYWKSSATPSFSPSRQGVAYGATCSPSGSVSPTCYSGTAGNYQIYAPCVCQP